MDLLQGFGQFLPTLFSQGNGMGQDFLGGIGGLLERLGGMTGLNFGAAPTPGIERSFTGGGQLNGFGGLGNVASAGAAPAARIAADALAGGLTGKPGDSAFGDLGGKPVSGDFKGAGPADAKGFSSKYDGMIAEAAKKYGVDANLVKGLIQQESGFNPKAKSPCGAAGLMQLMPGTAKQLGVKNRYDPRQSIMGGTKYLAQQLKTFNGNVKKAVAAYNAGPGAVKKYGGVPPYKETKNYVKNVLANKNKLDKAKNGTKGKTDSTHNKTNTNNHTNNDKGGKTSGTSTGGGSKK